MAFQYTRSALKAKINSRIFGKQGLIIDFDEVVNSAVRQAISDVDMTSAKRKATLSPNLYNGIFDYVCPDDLAGYKIIDVPAQAKRQDGEFFLVPTGDFEIKKQPGMIAIDDYNGTRTLKINSKVDSDSLTIAELDSLTSGSSDGTSWAAIGDAESLAADTDDYIKGNGSIKWDISSAGGTTAGIQHSAINSQDLTDYFGGTSSFFVWTRINSTTNITSYTLRFGSSSGNYYYKTVTARADGTAFVAGWNLLKFDISSLGTVGTPDRTAVTFYAIFMNKAAGKISETDYKFDWLVLKRGVIHELKYYSSYGWNSSVGAYKENSTDDLDVVTFVGDEYEFLIEKGVELAAREVREFEVATDAAKTYKDKIAKYQKENPSEAKIMTSEYYAY